MIVEVAVKTQLTKKDDLGKKRSETKLKIAAVVAVYILVFTSCKNYKAESDSLDQILLHSYAAVAQMV